MPLTWRPSSGSPQGTATRCLDFAQLGASTVWETCGTSSRTSTCFIQSRLRDHSPWTCCVSIFKTSRCDLMAVIFVVSTNWSLLRTLGWVRQGRGMSCSTHSSSSHSCFWPKQQHARVSKNFSNDMNGLESEGATDGLITSNVGIPTTMVWRVAASEGWNLRHNRIHMPPPSGSRRKPTTDPIRLHLQCLKESTAVAQDVARSHQQPGKYFWESSSSSTHHCHGEHLDCSNVLGNRQWVCSRCNNTWSRNPTTAALDPLASCLSRSSWWEETPAKTTENKTQDHYSSTVGFHKLHDKIKHIQTSGPTTSPIPQWGQSFTHQTHCRRTQTCRPASPRHPAELQNNRRKFERSLALIRLHLLHWGRDGACGTRTQLASTTR